MTAGPDAKSIWPKTAHIEWLTERVARGGACRFYDLPPRRDCRRALNSVTGG